MKRWLLAVVLGAVLGVALAQKTTITYWQYAYDTRVSAMDQLIKQFEQANPDITVKQETFPYNSYQQQVAASLPAGQGADVVQLYYGWLDTWMSAGYVKPLPSQYFDTAALDQEFIPMTQAAKRNGEYYGLPTAVRSLALFYNKDMFKAAGIQGPPKTWDEFVADAKALTKSSGPRMTQEGFGFAPNGQGHNLLREVLIRQYGGQPYSADGTKVAYNDEAGLKAFEFYTGLVTNDKVAQLNFVPGDNGYRDGFSKLDNIAMIVDGSFAIGDVKANANFDWGVAELPTLANGVKSDFGSFWMNGLTPNAFKDPAKLEAASKFLKFVTSPDAMKLWLTTVGELPARASLVGDPTLSADPVYGPFIKSLAYSHATQFVDESGQRQVFMDAVNRVILQHEDPAASWAQAAKDEQAILDKAHGM
ncbi:MAG TPA: extracellular solute-binding protein [Trueperaceae bacterium]|nr:extracellular solute-binding protein [Trueperaceae bacterium]